MALTPPDTLSEPVAQVWAEIVQVHPRPHAIVGPALETYCTLVATLREARDRIEREGLVVESPRGEPVPHPALAVERATAKELRGWGDRFSPIDSVRRRSGYMVDATRKSLKAATHVTDMHAGPRAALLTLAWLIDEAQREGIDALQKVAFGAIPTYLKTAAEMQITPAAPRSPSGGSKGGGRLGHLRVAGGTAVPTEGS